MWNPKPLRPANPDEFLFQVGSPLLIIRNIFDEFGCYENTEKGLVGSVLRTGRRRGVASPSSGRRRGVESPSSGRPTRHVARRVATAEALRGGPAARASQQYRQQTQQARSNRSERPKMVDPHKDPVISEKEDKEGATQNLASAEPIIEKKPPTLETSDSGSSVKPVEQPEEPPKQKEKDTDDEEEEEQLDEIKQQAKKREPRGGSFGRWYRLGQQLASPDPVQAASTPVSAVIAERQGRRRKTSDSDTKRMAKLEGMLEKQREERGAVTEKGSFSIAKSILTEC